MISTEFATGTPATSPDPGAEHRVTVSLICTSAPGGAQLRRHADIVRLHRDENGRVTGSVRVPATRFPDVADAQEETGQRIAHDLWGRPPGRLPARPGLRWQSAVITVTNTAQVLVRLESMAGPVLAGGSGTAVGDALLSHLTGVAPLLTAPLLPRHASPSGWRELPVVLRPPVAAAVLAGVRWVLGSAGAARLEGRRLLPPMTLIDRPVAHAAGEQDDAGHLAAPWALVRGGTVATMPRDPATNLPAGRMVWHHDEHRLVAARTFGLELTGVAGRPPGDPPPEAVELVECVQRVRHYQTDGRMRLVCVARAGQRGRPFLVGLAGRPLTVLRLVSGLAGAAAETCTDHSVRTPSLVLPTALSLERSADVRLAAL